MTNKILHYLMFLMFLIVFDSYSQTNRIIQVKGIVVNSKKEPLSFTHILISNKHKGTVCDENGKFDFFAEKGDSLDFFNVGYKKYSSFIPLKSDLNIYYIFVILEPDTIEYKEVVVYPWVNYEHFKRDFVTKKLLDDDIVKAEKNFALMELQYKLYEDEMPSSSAASFNFAQNQKFDMLYWKGQSQPMQIFNLFAWQKFFQYLKDGKFKSKKVVK